MIPFFTLVFFLTDRAPRFGSLPQDFHDFLRFFCNEVRFFFLFRRLFANEDARLASRGSIVSADS